MTRIPESREDEVKHTPGPWRFELAPLGQYNVVGTEGDKLATVHGRLPNARLFAAAPDMLAMLKSLRRTVASMGADLKVTAPESTNANTYQDELDRIDALVAKAEGRS